LYHPFWKGEKEASGNFFTCNFLGVEMTMFLYFPVPHSLLCSLLGNSKVKYTKCLECLIVYAGMYIYLYII
jgi:hypothetical protein